MRRAPIALLFGLLGTPRTGAANPIDLFGFGPRLAALGDAGVALGDSASAAFSNPAACTRPPLVLALGWGYGSIRARRNGRDLGLPDAHGFDASVCVPIALGPVRIGASTSLHMPDQWIARIALEPASRPRFVMWDNRPHRVAYTAALGVAIGRLASVGGGVTFLADGAGNGIDFRVGIRSGQVISESALDVELPLRAAPVLGLLVTPRDDLRFGLRYSGALSLDLRLDVLAQVNVPGTPIGGDTLVSVRGIDLYTPEQVAAGVSFGPWRGWLATAALVWANWSALELATSDVALDIEIGVSPSLLQLRPPRPGYADTLSPRLGIERTFEWPGVGRLAARLGYRFEPTPVPAQHGLTSLLDQDRHVIGLGGGLRVPLRSRAAWTLDASLAWHHLLSLETRKDDPTAPGGDFRIDGEVIAASLMTGVEL